MYHNCRFCKVNVAGKEDILICSTAKDNPFLKTKGGAKMRKFIFIVLILGVILIFLSCATSSLKDYEPKSSDEEDLVSQLMKYEEAWNNGDVQGCADLLHDDAKMRYGAEKLIASKAEYKNLLPRLMTDYPDFEFSEPSSINISGRSATFTAILKYTDKNIGKRNNLLHWVEFYKEDNQWLMIAWTY
jgi:hypothetical protein